jgi:hypothetical protein
MKKVVSPTHRPLLSPRKYSWYAFLVQVELTLRSKCSTNCATMCPNHPIDCLLGRAFIVHGSLYQYNVTTFCFNTDLVLTSVELRYAVLLVCFLYGNYHVQAAKQPDKPGHVQRILTKNNTTLLIQSIIKFRDYFYTSFI